MNYMSVKITAHPLCPAAWQHETATLLKLGCWVTSSRGGNGKVEATSMRLDCKSIHPPPHSSLTQGLHSFFDLIYSDQRSVSVARTIFGRVDTTRTARDNVEGGQLGYLTFYP